MMCGTLQEFSGGRFLLGLAAGAEDFLGWAGIDRDAPCDERRRPSSPSGRCARTPAAARHPGSGERWRTEARPARPRRPTPIYLGAMSPRMPESIGEIADGGLPLLYPPESFVDARRASPRGCARAGRQRRDIDLAACIWVSVDRDRRSKPAATGREARLLRRLVLGGPALADVGVEPTCWPRCAISIRRTAAARPAAGDDVAGHQRHARRGRRALPRSDRRRRRVTYRSARRSAPTAAGHPLAR